VPIIVKIDQDREIARSQTDTLTCDRQTDRRKPIL